MDIWGVTWIILSFLLFPFGYKPLLLLLVLSSIFQASSAFALGALNMPLSPFVELVFILRLFFPINGKGFVNFRNKKILTSFLLILIIWGYTYLATHLFSGMRVFSSLQSFELNFITNGMPLKWSGANINQLIILSIHLVTLGFIYYRRNEIDKEFFLKCILFSFIIFVSFCIVWKFMPGLYAVISALIFNNASYSVTSIYEGRAAGTFAEPSLAGVYICSFAIPLLCSRQLSYKIIGLSAIGIFGLNLSTSGLFTLLVSVPITFILLVRKTIRNYMISSFLALGMAAVAIPLVSLLTKYAAQKSSSDSGLMRGAANSSAIDNIINSYGFGIGVGSERASSLLIALINNLGIFILSFMILFIYKMIHSERKNEDKIALALFMVSLVGSFSGNPEYTLAFIWVFLYASVVCGNNSENKI